MMFLAYLTSAIVVTLFLLYYYFTRTFSYWTKRNVAGPKPIPFFGNLKESALRRKGLGDVTKEIHDNFPNEKVVGIYRMTTPCLLIRDLDLVKQIFIKDFDVFPDRGVEFSKEGLGNNLVHASEEPWRILRNKFTPIFTSAKLKNMVHLVNERGDKLVDYIGKLCVQQPEQDVYSILQKFTTSVIAACAFGMDIDVQFQKMEALEIIDKYVLTCNCFYELDMMYPGILKSFGSSLVPKVIKNFFSDLVQTAVRERKGKPTNRNDFMDLLLELRNQKEIQNNRKTGQENETLELTDDVIAAQAFIFYVAGYETSATTMSFMLYQLALNPKIQDILIAEIDEVLEKNGGKLTYETLKDMKYLSKVFDETLRMYPIVDPLQRRAKYDYKIPGTEVTIKKGQTVVVSALGVHHDEKHYPDPEIFNPERFSAENSRQRHPCANLSFGAGPRNCIGMRFAEIQSGVGIVKLMSKFRVEPSVNTKETIQFNPRRFVNGPDGGICLNIVPRN